MKAAGLVLALVAALALQTTVSRFSIGSVTGVNLVLIAVVYIALMAGPVAGLFAGTVGGLTQDALSGGLVGIGGFAKTLVGFVVGVVGSQFIVAQPLPRLVVFFSATVVHEVVVLAVQMLMPDARTGVQYARIMRQALINALVGLAVIQTVEWLPGFVQRRRVNRAASLRRRKL